MTARVLFDRYLIEIEEFTQTAGGIYAPGAAEDDKVLNARILTCGAACVYRFKQGTRIVVGRHSGTELDNSYINKIGIDEESASRKKKVINEKDILIVLED